MAAQRNGRAVRYDSDDQDTGDTIRVASAMVLDSDDEDNPLIGLEKAERQEMKRQLDEAQNAIYAGKGKGKAKAFQEALARAQATTQSNNSDSDVEMVDNETDDEVEEYTFSTEDENDQDRDDDEFDKKSVISLSSDTEDAYKPEVPAIDERPWRSMNDAQRLVYEDMFAAIHSKPLGPQGRHEDWSFTEEYQDEQDKVMGLYLKDFTLSNWVSDREKATAAIERWAERTRLRALDTKIFPVTRDRQPRQHQPYTTTHGLPTVPRPGGQGPQQHRQYRAGPTYGPPPPQQMLRSQPSARPMNIPPGMQLGQMGQPVSQPMGFTQHPHFAPHGGMPPPGMMYAGPQQQQMVHPPRAMYQGNGMPPPT